MHRGSIGPRRLQFLGLIGSHLFGQMSLQQRPTSTELKRRAAGMDCLMASVTSPSPVDPSPRWMAMVHTLLRGLQSQWGDHGSPYSLLLNSPLSFSQQPWNIHGSLCTPGCYRRGRLMVKPGLWHYIAFKSSNASHLRPPHIPYLSVRNHPTERNTKSLNTKSLNLRENFSRNPWVLGCYCFCQSSCPISIQNKASPWESFLAKSTSLPIMGPHQ